MVTANISQESTLTMGTRHIELKDWNAVLEYIDSNDYQIPMSTIEYIMQHASILPKDAFSKGQLASKSWLLQSLNEVLDREPINISTVGIVGVWIGTLVEPLLLNYIGKDIERIYGFDMDPSAIELSEKLNDKYVANQWQYKGVVVDVNTLDFSNLQFETGNELINTKLNMIVNTSSEHMTTEWFDSIDSDTLIVMQTNNSPDFEGHINTCNSLSDMQTKYPLHKTLYIGKLNTPAYTRYMQIGYKR